MTTPRHVALAAALSLLAPALALAPARAADNYSATDASGAPFQIKAKETSAGVKAPQFIPSDATGAPLFAAGNPGAVTLPSGQTVVLGGGSAAVGSVSVSASALPAGAATAAKQPALGTAGTPSADVLTVQGAAGGTPLKVDGSAARGSTVTQTCVALTAATSASLVAANANRKLLRWQNVGVNPVTIVPGAGPAVAGQGQNFDPGATVNNQGGGVSFDGGVVPTNAFAAISTGGTTVCVWEGN